MTSRRFPEREWPQAYTVMGVIGSIAAPIIVALLGSTLSSPTDPEGAAAPDQGRQLSNDGPIRRDPPPTPPDDEEPAPEIDDGPEPETATETDTGADTETDTDTDTGTGTETKAAPPSGGTYTPPGTGRAFPPPGTESPYDDDPDIHSKITPPPKAPPPPPKPPPEKFVPGGI